MKYKSRRRELKQKLLIHLLIVQQELRQEFESVFELYLFLLRYSFLLKVTDNAGLYHYAGNNPERYIDPDGRFLIKTENAEKVALSNKSFLSSIQAYMEPMAIANDGRILNINLLSNRSIPLSKDLDKAIDNVKRERANPSPYTKAMIIATCKKLDNDIYKINIIAAILIETPDGLIISSNNPETVAYATAAEVGISKFHSTPDQHKVNEIANKVLSYTNKGVTVDE